MNRFFTAFRMTLQKTFFSFSPILKFRVQEESMLPLFHPGDTVLVYRFSYIFIDPKEKDIIVLRSPLDGKYLLKQIEKIDGRKYFVVGANTAKSIDSRQFGWISKGNIVGKVIR